MVLVSLWALGVMAQTPTRDVVVETVDWAGNIVPDTSVCIGNASPGEEALFGKGLTGPAGSVRLNSIPAGGEGRGQVVVIVTKACPVPVQPAGRVNNIDVYACGVGADWFAPNRVPATAVHHVRVALGAADEQSALGAPAECGPTVASPYPAQMALRPPALQLDVGMTGIVTVRFPTTRNTEGLYDYRWEIDDRSIAEFAAGSPPVGHAAQIVGKSAGMTTIVAYRQNIVGPGTPRETATDTATIVVGGGVPRVPTNPEHCIGAPNGAVLEWRTPISDANYPNCVDATGCPRITGTTICGIVNSFVIARTDNRRCSECHYQGGSGNWTPPTGMNGQGGIEKDLFVRHVDAFIARTDMGRPGFKPQYLRDLLDKWKADGFR